MEKKRASILVSDGISVEAWLSGLIITKNSDKILEISWNKVLTLLTATFISFTPEISALRGRISTSVNKQKPLNRLRF